MSRTDNEKVSGQSLAGRVVAITGGARGIGRATAAALVVAEGARVAIGDLDAAMAEAAAREIGVGTLGLPLDVTSRASFNAFLEEVEVRLGPLDVLINNAGITPVGPLVEEPDDTTERALAINLFGVMLGSKLALERFLPRHAGHIVNMASLAGKGGFANGATYCATKHAVVGLSEALRVELRDSDVRLTVVLPVAVNSDSRAGKPNPGGLNIVEPREVVAAIIEALRTGRFEVYVPAGLAAIVRANAMMPRAVVEAIRFRARPWVQARKARRRAEN